METASSSLKSLLDGWDSHELALMRAITPLTPEQLAWRPAPGMNSVAQLISHIALGRLWWFYQMGAPGSAALARQVPSWESERVDAANPDDQRRWGDALQQVEDSIIGNPAELIRWQEATWQMIETTLTTWTVADLSETYRRIREGQVYAVSRQWTIWRILSHDLHHGGELALCLGLQGIEVPDLGDRGGHLTPLPLAQ